MSNSYAEQAGYRKILTTWRTCKIHGNEDPNVYGCAECVRTLREELQSAREVLEVLGDDISVARQWLDAHPEPTQESGEEKQ